jgi:mRNA-degrading endonuclease RelE of RelBE toxin-antitoxin system
MASAASRPPDVIEAPAYSRDIETLRASHKLVDDLVAQTLATEIKLDPTCGWPIRGWDSRVYKIRIPDKCHNRGKSNGFRLIYDWNPTTKTITLLRLYTHAQMEDISFAEIKKAREGADIS